MNKLYILICAIVLSGCGQSITTRTMEEYNLAQKYCTDNGAVVKLNYGTMICVKDGVNVTIPEKVFK